MATVRRLSDQASIDALKELLAKSFQSASINFLIGSGASHPAIKTAGGIENEIEALIDSNEPEKADRKLFGFLKAIQTSTNKLVQNKADSKIIAALENYRTFIQRISVILYARKSDLLSKQANIFTTNYDLLIEKAAEKVSTLMLNDGFDRKPNLKNRFIFSTQTFFNSIFNSGNIYNYHVQIPAINLIKLHGSLSWKSEDNEIVFHVGPKATIPVEKDGAAIAAFNDKHVVVLPERTKYGKTLVNQVYYDLLRIYSNELDKQNVLLIVFGFSFLDKHILDITKRALKNPTLKIVIFAHSIDDLTRFESMFDSYNNVDIVGMSDEEKTLDFAIFDLIISIFDKTNS